MRKLPTRMTKTLSRAVLTLSVWLLAIPAFPAEPGSDRVIDLKGTTNTRDIGGYQAGDLRTLRWGQIIRSENLSRLTADDFQKLEDIGVKTVIDLRTDREHEKAPTVWLGENPPSFYHFPVGDAQNEWFKSQRRMFKRNRFTEEQALEHMKKGYRMIAEEGTSSYQKLMDVVLDEANWPILIHCNAGKDRAGIAVTLILEALGVDRETIMEEYLLTNEIGRVEDKARFLAKESKQASSARGAGRGPSVNAWLPIVGVHPEMLEAFYASVDENYGSMDAFLAELGVDSDERRGLLASLTTEPSEIVMSD